MMSKGIIRECQEKKSGGHNLIKQSEIQTKKKLSETKNALYNINCKIHNDYVRYINSKQHISNSHAAEIKVDTRKILRNVLLTGDFNSLFSGLDR